MGIYNGVADDYEFDYEALKNKLHKKQQKIYESQKITSKVISDDTLIYNITVPRTIATITVCGAITVNITDNMKWTPPTEEQIKNLHDLFCIDVNIVED